MRDFFEVREVGVEQGGADGEEVGVAGVVDFDGAPGVLAKKQGGKFGGVWREVEGLMDSPSADSLTIHLDHVLGPDDSEGHEPTELGILFDGVFVVFLDVVWEVVDGDAVVLDILHDQFLALHQLERRERVRFADDGDDVDARGETAHQLDVQLAEAVAL